MQKASRFLCRTPLFQAGINVKGRVVSEIAGLVQPLLPPRRACSMPNRSQRSECPVCGAAGRDCHCTNPLRNLGH